MDDTPTPFQPFDIPHGSPDSLVPHDPPRQRRKRRTKAEIEAARLSAGKKRRPYVRRHDKHAAADLPAVGEPAPQTGIHSFSVFAQVFALLQKVDRPTQREILRELGKLLP